MSSDQADPPRAIHTKYECWTEIHPCSRTPNDHRFIAGSDRESGDLDTADSTEESAKATPKLTAGVALI